MFKTYFLYFPLWTIDCPILNMIGIYVSIYVQVCMKIQYISEKEADKQKQHITDGLLETLDDVETDLVHQWIPVVPLISHNAP